MSTKKYKIGIVLSGGGAKGFAHLGVLQAMYENNIKPDIIAGASVGAIAGALYADGYTPLEMLSMFKDNSFFNLISPKINKNSFMKSDKLKKKMQSLLHAQTFEDLQIPLVLSASNLTCGRVAYFKSGKLLDKVLASSSIPVLFNPILINEEYYVDGGMFDNFPVEQIRDKCEFVIGSHLHPFKKQENIKTLKQNIERTITLIYETHGWKKANQCDVFIEPKGLSDFSIFDVRKGLKMYEIAYMETQRVLQENAVVL
ncbi:MAG: patatin-like phospholipase family protein [Bacteroidales bacterium]|nr:patatin-like phospholipase family protein [Bacteroidales bacterium]